MAPIIGITFIENIEDDPSNNYIRAIKEFGAYLVRCTPAYQKMLTPVSMDFYSQVAAIFIQIILVPNGTQH